MNFKTFFESNIMDLKFASNPRHRTVGGITNGNRKHQNVVARSQGINNQYISQNVVRAKYNKTPEKINEIQARQEAEKYGINLDKRDKNTPFQISLKQRDSKGFGRFLSYDPQNGYSIEYKQI
jgi:hypothetical protein